MALGHHSQHTRAHFPPGIRVRVSHCCGVNRRQQSAIVADALVRAGGRVHLAALARPGDVVLLMGAGNVTDLAAPILASLRDAKASFAVKPRAAG